MTDFDPHNPADRKDSEFDGIIRPQELSDFTGQKEIVSNLDIYIRASRPGQDHLGAYHRQ